jgi:hypothetical protein
VRRRGVHSLHSSRHILLYTGSWGRLRRIASVAVEGKPIEQVRAMWAAYQRGGVDALHDVVGDAPVEWVPLDAEEPVPPEQFWGDWGRRRREQVSITMHSFEEHGACVVANGSMRTFSEGGFADVQPSWVYCFRGDVLVHAQAHPTREAALEAITRWEAA